MTNKVRILSLLLSAALSTSLLAGCAQNVNNTASEAQAAQAAESSESVNLEEMTAEEGPIVELGALLDEAVPLAGGAAISTVLSPVASGSQTKANSSATIDYSNTKDGYVMAKWSDGGSPKIKVLVKGPSGTTYQYNLRTDGNYDTFPLSDGNGTYTIGVYKNTSGTQYSTVVSCSTDVKLNDEFAPFIRPNQYVTFNANSEAVKKAAELCANTSDNLDKVTQVYNYVINNVTYDKEKAQSVKSGYLPNVDNTLKTKKGICFDYAALMSAMLRSQSVPVKLVIGYTGSVYHAWINVYSEKDGWIEGKIYFDGKQWKLMDPTFASSGKQSDSIMQYIGTGSNYTAKYLY